MHGQKTSNNFLERFSKKNSNVKLHRFPSSDSRFVPCGHTDIAKLIFAFRNLTNAPKMASLNKLEDWNCCDNYNCLLERGIWCCSDVRGGERR